MTGKTKSGLFPFDVMTEEREAASTDRPGSEPISDAPIATPAIFVVFPIKERRSIPLL